MQAWGRGMRAVRPLPHPYGAVPCSTAGKTQPCVAACPSQTTAADLLQCGTAGGRPSPPLDTPASLRARGCNNRQGWAEAGRHLQRPAAQRRSQLAPAASPPHRHSLTQLHLLQALRLCGVGQPVAYTLRPLIGEQHIYIALRLRQRQLHPVHVWAGQQGRAG